MVNRGGRGDRTGRYENTHNDHNFRDMDYRGYDQEDEEVGTGYDVRADGDGPYGHEEPSLGDFSSGCLQDRPGGFHPRGDGRGDIGREGKGLLWTPQSDSALPMLQREDDGSRREFEHILTGPQERGRGRGFPDNSASRSGGREGNWGHGGGVHPEQMEYNTVRQREEDRFSRAAVKRRVSHNKSFNNNIELLQHYLVLTLVSHLLYAGFCSGGRGSELWECLS